MLYSPYAIMDVFAIGEVVVGSEKNITEKYATKARIYYRDFFVDKVVTYEACHMLHMGLSSPTSAGFSGIFTGGFSSHSLSLRYYLVDEP